MKQRNPASYVYAGRTDADERTAWKRAPITPEQWSEGEYDAYQDQCLTAYWEGFYSRARDAYRRACVAAATADTTVSGYSPHGPALDPPDYDYYCIKCHNDPCSCNEPPHDTAYMAVWRDGEFDDDLCGWSEELAYVGFERVVAG